MKNKKISWPRIFQIITTIVTSIGLVYGAWLFLASIFSKFNNLNSNVLASIIAGFVAIFGILYNQRQAKNREINEVHRLKKVELYKKFMDFLVDILMRTKKEKIPKDKLPKELEKIFMEFTSNLIIWSSPKVIVKYKNFQEAAASQKVDILCMCLAPSIAQSIS